LAVPVWAERAAITSWHAGHIAERYGLFTIIVLGESILSASLAIQEAIQAGTVAADLVAIIVGGVLIVLCMWWLYFDQPAQDIHASLRTTFVWGYGHLVIFAAAAAVGAGLAVAIDQATDHAELGALGAGFAVAVPVALYLIGLWALHQQPEAPQGKEAVLFPGGALLVLLSPVSGQAVLITGLLLVALLAVKLVRRYRQHGHVM
jgi:low temperature requirement protein LtrA